MQLDAPFCQLDWKRRRMRTFLLATLNCFVRNKPGVAATTQIASTRVRPACDVAFVLIWNAEASRSISTRPVFVK